MNVSAFCAIPSAERLIRTIFWTFFALSTGFTAYGLTVEYVGAGLFAPRLYVRVEVRVTETLSAYASFYLAVMSLVIARWSRRLCCLGFAGCAFWLFQLALPRY